MNVLVVGGAGYIGSIMCRLLMDRGYHTTVLDNLSLGHRAAVDKRISFVEGDLSDNNLLEKIFTSMKVDAVMHFAAFALVAESVQNPLNYYYNNVANTANLLLAMRKTGVRYFIFSSSAAVFGNPKEIPIIETHPQRPINPYGRSKVMVEEILKDTSTAGDLNFVSLRYFNAAGAYPDGSLGEDHKNETHLIPLTLKATMDKEAGGRPLTIYGTDYDTPDGTCIRDYIHVLDLAEAHILALQYLFDGGKSDFFNLGNGKGFSVLEIIRVAEEVTGKKASVVYGNRRPGDPSVLVASSEKITKILGWQPRYAGIKTIIDTAWKWHSMHPRGYESL